MKKTNALRILDQLKIDYEILEYKYDSEQLDLIKIAADNDLSIEKIYKTLVLIGDKTGVIVAVVSGNHQLSLKKIATVSGNKKVEMAPIEDLEKISGYIRGGCSPLGMKKKYPLFLDANGKSLEKIFVNAGTRGILFGCSPSDLEKACGGIWSDIASES